MTENTASIFNQKIISELKKNINKEKNIGSLLGLASISAAMAGALPFIGALPGGIIAGAAAALAAHYLTRTINNEKIIQKLEKLYTKIVDQQAIDADISQQLLKMDIDQELQIKLKKLYEELEKEMKKEGRTSGCT